MAQHQVHQIRFILDNPFGPQYDAGEYVDIYWDDSTLALVVKENGGVITGGDVIVEFFTYNDLNQDAYKQEIPFNVQVCDGSDLLQFTRQNSFPYIAFTRLQDHPSCELITPVVCDLDFSALPTSTPVSSESATDGTITVLATSSAAGSVKYKLNSSFEYNDGTGQTSGTFTGLSRGNYVVFARDSLNCDKSISVLVGVSKSYGARYQLTFYNPCNHHIKAEILEKDYSGSVDDTIKGGTGSPLFLRSRREGETDKFIPVIATEVEFILESITNNQFIDIYTNDPEKFRIRVSVDTGSGYSVVWLGKVLPQQYQENYISPPYPVKVIATDGLPSLNETYLLDDDDNQLRGNYKQITLIAWILKKLGLGLSIRSACNIYATGMNSTASDDPLDQAYVDVFRYYIETGTPTCMDVLKKILTPYGAQLMQYDNYWNIVRVEEKVNSYDYRQYNESGVYVSNGSYNPVKNVKISSENSSLHYANQDANMVVEPGYGAIQLIYVLGLYNIFQNGEFRTLKSSFYKQENAFSGGFIDQVSADLSGFQIINSGNEIINSILTQDDSDNISLVMRYVNLGGYLLSNAVPLKMGLANFLRVTVKFKLNWDHLYRQNYAKVKFLIGYGNYFLLNSGEWSLTESNIVYYLKGEDYNKDQTFTAIGELPDTSFLSTAADFYIKIYLPHHNDWEFETLAGLKAKTTTDLLAGHKTEYKRTFSWSGSTYYIAYYEIKFTTDAADDVQLIQPNDYNASTNPKKWNLVNTFAIIENVPLNFTIHSIHADILQLGERQMPKIANFSKSMEPNNPVVINKIIHHGSIVQSGKTTYSSPTSSPEARLNSKGFSSSSFFDVTAQKLNSFINQSAASNNYGYFRNSSGTGYTTWKRDSVSESKTLEEIVMEMYAGQYNRPWQRISTSLYSDDTTLKPIDVIKDFTASSNKKYYPVSLEIDYYQNKYSGEFLELTDVSDSEGDNVSAGFTIGFTKGFNA